MQSKAPESKTAQEWRIITARSATPWSDGTRTGARASRMRRPSLVLRCHLVGGLHRGRVVVAAIEQRAVRIPQERVLGAHVTMTSRVRRFDHEGFMALRKEDAAHRLTQLAREKTVRPRTTVPRAHRGPAERRRSTVSGRRPSVVIRS